MESLATTILHDMYGIDNKHAFGHYIFLYVETQKILGLSRPHKISMIFLLVTKISRVTKIVYDVSHSWLLPKFVVRFSQYLLKTSWKYSRLADIVFKFMTTLNHISNVSTNTTMFVSE